MAFAELSITSNFTFLTGGSHPQEYALRAIELGLPAFAIADRNSVAGIVRAHHELKEAARDGAAVPRLLPAARLVPRRRARDHRAGARPRRLGAALPAADARRAPRARRASACCTLDDLTGLDALHLLLHPPPGGATCAPGCRGRAPSPRAHRHAHLVASPRYDGQDGGADRPRRAARREPRAAAGRLGRADHAPRLAAGGSSTC